MEDLYSAGELEQTGLDSGYVLGEQTKSNNTRVEYVYVKSSELLIESNKEEIEKVLNTIENPAYRAYWSERIYKIVEDEKDESQWYDALSQARELTIYPASLFKKNKINTDFINYKIKGKKISLEFGKRNIESIKKDMEKDKLFIKELKEFKAMIKADKKAAQA